MRYDAVLSPSWGRAGGRQNGGWLRRRHGRERRRRQRGRAARSGSCGVCRRRSCWRTRGGDG
eukprot:3787616-Prymnesium_polylepis.1